MNNIYSYVLEIKDMNELDIIKNIYNDFDDFTNRYLQIRFILFDKYNKYIPKEVSVTDEMKKDRDKYQQNKFRNNLLQRFHKCLVCNVDNPKLLQACHIKPYAETKSYDIDNGLILCNLHHIMFDNNMFYIDKEYNIKINEKCYYIEESNVKHILGKYKGIQFYIS